MDDEVVRANLVGEVHGSLDFLQGRVFPEEVGAQGVLGHCGHVDADTWAFVEEEVAKFPPRAEGAHPAICQAMLKLIRITGWPGKPVFWLKLEEDFFYPHGCAVLPSIGGQVFGNAQASRQVG